MKPCAHTIPWLPDPDDPAKGYCRICYLYATSEDYQRLWNDGTPAGAAPTLPPIRHTLPCIYLGKLVKRENCQCPRLDLRFCDLGHGIVKQADHCERCADYLPD